VTQARVGNRGLIVTETGLPEETLANIAWVGRRIEVSRQREDVDVAYHAGVIGLDPVDQEAVLERAAVYG
jgi:hypothetical protein